MIKTKPINDQIRAHLDNGGDQSCKTIAAKFKVTRGVATGVIAAWRNKNPDRATRMKVQQDFKGDDRLICAYLTIACNLTNISFQIAEPYFRLCHEKVVALDFNAMAEALGNDQLIDFALADFRAIFWEMNLGAEYAGGKICGNYIPRFILQTHPQIKVK